ncbi:sensor histidine kinase [Sediminispirochaeta smaragdinae]|uniref:histidine kinase n=1 Tax=Sediminispirochaeta smaragdinae (strain DSM 11293 / JCM 15392 / SEBR 4228) TaxID=573413 RepID=E1R347_SEDSS|nr:sensor histidine kinase [Sediminispirochaeta smaragdinae]ADK81233.1 signal transduction histidine kinase [Sediminispirochaeta smaragdinae DSM 11293]
MKWHIGVLAIIFFSTLSVAAAVPVHVLVLHSYHSELPWTKGFDEGLHDAQAQYPELQYYTEYLDASRVGDSLSHQQWAEYLRAKYHSVKIDAIISESGPAANILYSYPELFGPIPQVMYSPVPHKTANYQLSVTPQIEAAIIGTAKLAIAQNPKAKKAIIIDGGNPATGSTIKLLHETLNGYGVDVQTVSNFTLPEIQDYLSTCKPNSMAFYTLVLRDRTGKKFIPQEVLDKLAEVSAIPIYTFWGTLADSGSTGGTMLDAQVIAYEGIKAILNYLTTGEFGTKYGTTQTYINWKLLKRYKISPRTIPQNAIILNRPEPFLVKYYVETVTVVSILFILGFIIMFIQFRRNLAINRQLCIKAEELQNALKEKELLYNEMNNRIKNNLTILSSMIILQINEIKNKTTKQQLENVVGRLQTLALVHEELSNKKHIKETNIHGSLQALILQVFNTMSSEPAEKQLLMDIDEIKMENRDAIACCLIVHELLTNAIKFAFPHGASGTIHVVLKKLLNQEVALSVSDSGIGIPSSYSMETDAKLGLKIVRLLVKQLGGSLEIRNAGGAVFLIKFRI